VRGGDAAEEANIVVERGTYVVFQGLAIAEPQ
jgi:hypothetical protein